MGSGVDIPDEGIPAAEDVGNAIDLRTGGAIVPREAAIMESLGVPKGFVDVRDPSEIMLDILESLASVGSIEEALRLGVTKGLREFEGRGPLTFLDFKYQPSDYDKDGWPYVVMACADKDGQRVTVTTGAKQPVVLMALARKLTEAGQAGFPFSAEVQQVEFETPDGELRHAVKLVPVGS